MLGLHKESPANSFSVARGGGQVDIHSHPVEIHLANFKIDGIGLTLKEQASAARDIATRVENVSQGTEELAASAEQTAASARELAQVAVTMKGLANRFQLA